MSGNYEYGSAAVDDPRVFDQEDLGASDSERDDFSLWACAPESGDLSEVTEGWEPGEREVRRWIADGYRRIGAVDRAAEVEREPMSPFGALMMRRQADAFAEAR